MVGLSSRSCPDQHGRAGLAPWLRAAAVTAALATCATRAGAQALPQSIEDLRTATAVSLALAADPFTAATEVTVHARAGAIVVVAAWPSTGAEARAAALAAAVPGVVSVAMGDAPPQATETLGAGVALEPDETVVEAPEPETGPEPAAERLPVQQPRPTPVPEPAPAAAPDDGAVTHVVRLGDTLYSIARRYDTTVGALQRLNGLGDSTALALGQRLRVR